MYRSAVLRSASASARGWDWRDVDGVRPPVPPAPPLPPHTAHGRTGDQRSGLEVNTCSLSVLFEKRDPSAPALNPKTK